MVMVDKHPINERTTAKQQEKVIVIAIILDIHIHDEVEKILVVVVIYLGIDETLVIAVN